MMTRFSSVPFLPMKNTGDTYSDAPSTMRPKYFSCLTQSSSISPSALERGYGLHLIDLGAAGSNLIVMFGFLFGGNLLESSSENTLQYLLNSSGMVSIVK